VQWLVGTVRVLESELPPPMVCWGLNRNLGQDLLNSARAFASDAAPLKAQFISLNLPADFLDQLATHTGAFETASKTKGEGLGAQAGATGGLEDTAHKAAVALHVLATIVRNTYANNPVKRAEWVVASHVEKHPPCRRRKRQPRPRRNRVQCAA
jgi:hypothetical protein